MTGMADPVRVLAPQVGMNRRQGGGRFDYETLAALARSGADVLVLLPAAQRDSCEIPPGCRVRWVRGRWRGHPYLASALFLPAIVRSIRDFQPDVIRVHSPYYFGPAALFAGRLWNVPTIACFHHRYERFRGSEFTERHVFPRFDHVVTVSRFSQGQLAELHPTLETRSSVLYNGVSRAFTAGDRSASRRALGWPQDEPLFVTTGSLIARKNVFWLLDLFDAYVRGGGRGRLVIVGDGPERRHVETAIARAGHGRAELRPSVDDVSLAILLRAADAFLFPSLMEGFGLVVAEAMACGTPAIVSDRGALPEVVTDGTTGFVLPLERGFDAWLAAMDRVLDAGCRAAMGVAAAKAAQRFDWDAAAKELTALCRGVALRHAQMRFA
jgi:glycosyltransferase involved in cell wall biosynthesis